MSRLLNFLNPLSFWENVMTCYRDVSNYVFYRKTINQLAKDGLLREKGMRTDLLKRVYFVINLLPETLLAGGDVELLERSRVTEAIAERNQIFIKDGILEIIEADYKRIKNEDYYAYLIWVKYRSVSTLGTWLRAIVWISLLITLTANYQMFIDCVIYLKNLYVKINN
jgi:hypothetical protein